MFKTERRNQIIKQLNKEGRVTVDSLSKKFKVTPTTIRRDLQYLDDKNMIKRTFGGAVLVSDLDQEVSHKVKSTSKMEEKIRIASSASSLVENGSIIILDSGTTNFEIAKKLIDKKDLTIITPDVFIAGFLSSNSKFKVICTGGVVQTDVGTCMGSLAIEVLKKVRVDMSFIGTSSIDSSYHLSTPTLEKAELKQEMMRSSKYSILVTDSSKFGKDNFVKICQLKDFDLVISDKDIASKEEKLKKLGISIRLV